MLQVFGSDNIKIRIQHIKIHRIIWRKSSWGAGAAKLNENRSGTDYGLYSSLTGFVMPFGFWKHK